MEGSDGEANRSPETAAITGGAPAAAEPSPQIRDREGTARSIVYVLDVLAVALGLTAIFADQDSDGTLGTALAALILLGVAALRIGGVIGPVLTSVMGFVAGIVFTVLAFSATNFDFPQLILVVCGAATFIVSFASLAASRKAGSPGEEPVPGVENV